MHPWYLYEKVSAQERQATVNNKIINVYNGRTIRENASSCGFVIRYGKFDFLTAGDIGDYYDYEYAVASVVGQVEATKAHHHLSPHSMCQKSMEVLRPQTVVATSFYVREIQPDKSKFGYMAELEMSELDMLDDLYYKKAAKLKYSIDNFILDQDGNINKDVEQLILSKGVEY